MVTADLLIKKRISRKAYPFFVSELCLSDNAGCLIINIQDKKLCFQGEPGFRRESPFFVTVILIFVPFPMRESISVTAFRYLILSFIPLNPIYLPSDGGVFKTVFTSKPLPLSVMRITVSSWDPTILTDTWSACECFLTLFSAS